MKDKITFCLGSLSSPLLAYCEKHGITPSEAIKAAKACLKLLMRAEILEGKLIAALNAICTETN